MLRLILSEPAQQDITNILLYTLQTWGAEQEAIYAAALEEKMEHLREHPTAGRIRPDLKDNYRSYRVKHHIIYYAVTERSVYIARILHGRMDAHRHL